MKFPLIYVLPLAMEVTRWLTRVAFRRHAVEIEGVWLE